MTRTDATVVRARAWEAAAHVLQAERSALAQIEQCRIQAAQMVAQSQCDAESVQKNAHARILRLRERMEQGARQRREQVRKEADALDADPAREPVPPDALDRALRQLVDELVAAVPPD